MKHATLGVSLTLSLVVLATGTSRASAQCGDGTVGGGEACDDGNTADGDGCSAACAVEAGFACISQPPIALINPSFDLPITSASPGWVLAAGTIDQIGTGCLPADHGTLAVDMNGSSRGEIYQDIATTPGATYVMTLRGSANCIEVSGQPCSRTCVKRLTVSAADTASPTAPYTTTTYDLPGGPLAVGGAWQDIRFQFTAMSTMTRIRFSGSDPSFAGPMVDRAAIAESVCRPDTCGNSLLDALEACDDGNQIGGDGCTSDCANEEVGWMCTTPGMACTSTCGDGVKVSDEECDDGDTMGGDGCSATCTIEPGWTCIVDPLDIRSICAMVCGNATVDPGEACDDGGESAICDANCTAASCGDTTVNMTAGEACDAGGESATCDGDCTAVACGDGRQNATAGEACDDGNMTVGDGCSATCTVELPDAGTDAGVLDAGVLDAGVLDAGVLDAGVLDAGVPDAGVPDAGASDAGTPDAGFDGGAIDAGAPTGGLAGGACSCSMTAPARPSGLGWASVFAVLALALRRRRVER